MTKSDLFQICFAAGRTLLSAGIASTVAYLNLDFFANYEVSEYLASLMGFEWVNFTCAAAVCIVTGFIALESAHELYLRCLIAWRHRQIEALERENQQLRVATNNYLRANNP